MDDIILNLTALNLCLGTRSNNFIDLDFLSYKKHPKFGNKGTSKARLGREVKI